MEPNNLKTAPVLPSRSSDATLWINKLNLASKHCDATRAGAMEMEVGLESLAPARDHQAVSVNHMHTSIKRQLGVAINFPMSPYAN